MVFLLSILQQDLVMGRDVLEEKLKYFLLAAPLDIGRDTHWQYPTCQ